MWKLTKKLVLPIFLCLGLGGCMNKSESIIEDKKDGNGIITTGIPSSENDYYQPFFKDINQFKKTLEKKALNDTVVPVNFEETGYDDIWIRDVAPVVTTRLVKFKYSPDYLDAELSQSLEKNFNQWLESENFDVIYSKLILDGGNFAWNKKDIAIITDRILKDNESLTREEIVNQLKSELKVNKIILIPPEAGDVLAHADGMVKFIDENTLFISDFLGDETFRLKVEKIILNEMPDAKFVTMKSAYTEEGQYDEEIASAKGLYINMLETDTAIYFPQFGLPEDKEMLEFVSKYVTKEVIPVDIGNLSTMGGAINCLTWYCPNEYLPSTNQK